MSPAQYVLNGQGQGGKIQFDPNVELNDEYTLEEFFHAFQDDNSGINEKVSKSNIEYEAKLFTFLTQMRLVLLACKSGGTSESLDNIVISEFSENMTSEEFQSSKFLQLYANGVKDFSDYWKANDPQKKFPSYQAPPSTQGPVNLYKATREAEVNSENIIGPRLENGDFYSN
jgi:hypothetical protein